MSNTYDLTIIGGGPAGAAAAVYAARKRLRSVMITKDWIGQSNVSDKIENWVGTIAISGADLSKSLENHAKAYGENIIDFKDNEICTNIAVSGSGKNKLFTIKTSKGLYISKTILIASGSHRRKMEVIGAQEFENKGLTYCATCDGPIFAGMDVVVVGGGNAGFESAAQLLAYCKSVTLLSRSEFKADPGTVERVCSKPNMKAIEFAVPKEIKGDKFVTSIIYTDSRTKTDHEIKASGIFAEIGSTPNSDFVKNVIDLDKFNRIVVNPKTQAASEDGIWAAGDVTDGLYHQNNIAAGDAVKAIEDIYIWLHAK